MLIETKLLYGRGMLLRNEGTPHAEEIKCSKRKTKFGCHYERINLGDKNQPSALLFHILQMLCKPLEQPQLNVFLSV